MGTKDSEKQQVIVFKLEDKLYGINIDQIREITRVGEISPVPNAPPYIEGVTNLRGQVTTVIDLRKRLGIPPTKFDKQSRMIIVESKGYSQCVIVDSVAEVMMIPKTDIEDTPEIARVQNNASYIIGIGKKDDKLIILIDLHKLLEIGTTPEDSTAEGILETAGVEPPLLSEE